MLGSSAPRLVSSPPLAKLTGAVPMHATYPTARRFYQHATGLPLLERMLPLTARGTHLTHQAADEP